MKQFERLAKFAEHIAELAVIEEHMVKRAVSHCAKMVEKEAKAEIGSYQDQAGPFVAWAELAEATTADGVRNNFSENDPLLRSGDMMDSIGTTIATDGMEAQIGSNSDIAVYQELGTKNIPPRSFLGGAMVRKLPEIKVILGETVVATLRSEKVFNGEMPIE